MKAVIRAVGLNPDNNFRFREFGGAKSRRILATRRIKSDHMQMLNFSASLTKVANPQDVNRIGIHSSRPFVISTFLSASRIEVGFPEPMGDMVNRYEYSPFVMPDVEHPGTTGAPEPTPTTYFHGISNNKNDGLFTSGSFTYEARYRFDRIRLHDAQIHPMTQSLMRLNVTGSAAALIDTSGVTGHGTIFNLVVTSGTLSTEGTLSTGSLFLYGRPGIPTYGQIGWPSFTNQLPTLQMILTGVNLFDGGDWYISWGRQCPYEIGSHASASYFLRAAKQNNGELLRYYSTSTLYRPWDDYASTLSPHLAGAQGVDVLDSISQGTYGFNASGSFITLGSQSLAA